MVIMGSSNSNNRLYDRLRKKWVEKTPEEAIRQHLLQMMVDKLGYPPALICVEKELALLPHLKIQPNLPKRRADIIVFDKSEGTLLPLLMIECKVKALTCAFAQQVIGYNAFVQAPYLAIANEREVLTGHFDQEAGIFTFKKGLVHFESITFNRRTEI